MTELLAGRYRIDGLLGRGGMSEVYHGYDERLDRRVAIKVLRPPAHVPAAPDSPEAVEILDALDRDRKRFLREIRVTAQLEHPGTPAVYDTGVETAPDGTTRLWLVMQLLRGSTLEALLNHADYESSPPSVAWAAAIAAQIAAVLADVHRVDIVHRDIKPGNVMITDGGLVKVLDFGIAILRGAGALPRLTQVDRTVGTPAYMSPEQCLGQVVTAGRDYRRYFPPNDPDVLHCAYHAGHAYAETGKPGKALPQLRFYVQNADTSAGGDEARKVLETRFVIAQLLAADGYPDEALAELQAVRPLLAEAFGPGSTQVRNLDKQAARLRTPQ